MVHKLTDQEVAFRVLNIYFEEVARRGIKRKLDFDSILNSYFYVLEKVKSTDSVLPEFKEKIVKEEERMLHQQKKDLVPAIERLKEKIPEKHY